MKFLALFSIIFALGTQVVAQTYRNIKWGSSEAQIEAALLLPPEKSKGQPRAEEPAETHSDFYCLDSDGRGGFDKACSTFMPHVIADVEVEQHFFLSGDRLVGVKLVFGPDSFETIRSAFRQKFGPPGSVSSSSQRNAMGAIFQNVTIAWRGKQARIVLTKYDDRIDRSGASFMTPEWDRLIGKRGKLRKNEL